MYFLLVFNTLFILAIIAYIVDYFWSKHKIKFEQWQGVITQIDEDSTSNIESAARWFKIIVKLSDGSVKHVEINKELYKEFNVNDSLIKNQGELYPQKVNSNN